MPKRVGGVVASRVGCGKRASEKLRHRRVLISRLAVVRLRPSGSCSALCDTYGHRPRDGLIHSMVVELENLGPELEIQVVDLENLVVDLDNLVVDLEILAVDLENLVVELEILAVDLEFLMVDLEILVVDLKNLVVDLETLVVDLESLGWILTIWLWILKFWWRILKFWWWILKFGWWSLKFWWWILKFWWWILKFWWWICLKHWAVTVSGGFSQHLALSTSPVYVICHSRLEQRRSNDVAFFSRSEGGVPGDWHWGGQTNRGVDLEILVVLYF